MCWLIHLYISISLGDTAQSAGKYKCVAVILSMWVKATYEVEFPNQKKKSETTIFFKWIKLSYLKPATLWPDPLFVMINLQQMEIITCYKDARDLFSN